MKKSTRLIKRIVALFLVVLINIQSFAAIVGDSDGGAFVTKQEFEEMKENFDEQLDKYNDSIDKKVDGAIALYLAGQRVAERREGSLDSKTNYSFPLVMQSSVSYWNDATKKDFYNVARNRARYPQVTNTFFTWAGSGSGWSPSLGWLNTDTPTTYVTVPVGNKHNQYNYGFMKDNTTEIAPKAGELYEISNSGATRKMGSTNYKIFDVVNFGTGYQFVDYVPTIDQVWEKMAGHFDINATFSWVYSGVLCLESHDVDPGKYTPANNTFTEANWTDKYSCGSGYGAGNNRSIYNTITSDHIGEKLLLKNIREKGSGGSSNWTYNGTIVDSSQFVWSVPSKKSMVYAGTANVPAQLKSKFGYSPDQPFTVDTEVEKVGIRSYGFNKGFVFIVNATDTTTLHNSGTYQVRAWSYAPPLKCIVYNGYATTIPSFGALPASCVRYYDENGKAHFLDEGMYIRTFESDCNVEFELTFGAKSGTKNLNLYISKEPFNRTNGKTKLEKFRVGTDTTKVTSKTLSTGNKYKIYVDDIMKNEALYLLWEPTTSTDYVSLNSFKNFMIIDQ